MIALKEAECCALARPNYRSTILVIADFRLHRIAGKNCTLGYPAWGLTSGPRHWELACSSLGERACVRMGYPRVAQTLFGGGALEDRHRAAAGRQSPGDLSLDPDGSARS